MRSRLRLSAQLHSETDLNRRAKPSRVTLVGSTGGADNVNGTLEIINATLNRLVEADAAADARLDNDFDAATAEKPRSERAASRAS